MSVITVFSGICCNEERTVRRIAETVGYAVITDERVASEAAAILDVPASKIMRAFSARTSVFNKFTHEKECSVAHLKLALARMLATDRFLVHGFSGQLVPQSIGHVLRVCLIANSDYRVQQAVAAGRASEREAARMIRKSDEERAAWVRTLFHRTDPWEESLYDMVIPTHQTDETKAAGLVKDNLEKDILNPTDVSRQAVADFLLTAQTAVALSNAGHDVEVSAVRGDVTLTINKQVLMLNRLEEELKEIAGKVAGVTSVTTRIGKSYHQSNIYRKHDFSVPSRVLLVDDEREFVQTLSERLLLRDMGAATVYDGESALNMIRDDEPDVMIIDLKMPGIDGLEVLKRVKTLRPDIQVIVLTGHGSDADREQCMALGAFAYLQKPVDIELLSETLKKAHEKSRAGHTGSDRSPCR